MYNKNIKKYTKTTRQAKKSVARVAKMVKTAQKHHRQATNSVKRLKTIHKSVKGHAKSTRKGQSRKAARRAYM
jgi:hypothetical protein